MIAVHSATALVATTMPATFSSFSTARLQSGRGGSNIPTIMDAVALKDLAKTCWTTLEDLSPWKDSDSADAARAAKTAQQNAILMLLKDQLQKCSDCCAVVAWMQLRGRGISPGDSATLFASAYQSCLDGSHIGQFLLGYMYGFLGPIFWEHCDSSIGMVGRNKVEAIRLLTLAKEPVFMRPTASFFLGLLHEMDGNIASAKPLYAECPEHPLALFALSNCQSDSKQASALKVEANRLGYQRLKDAYFWFHGRGTGCDLSP